MQERYLHGFSASYNAVKIAIEYYYKKYYDIFGDASTANHIRGLITIHRLNPEKIDFNINKLIDLFLSKGFTRENAISYIIENKSILDNPKLYNTLIILHKFDLLDEAFENPSILKNKFNVNDIYKAIIYLQNKNMDVNVTNINNAISADDIDDVDDNLTKNKYKLYKSVFEKDIIININRQIEEKNKSIIRL